MDIDKCLKKYKTFFTQFISAHNLSVITVSGLASVLLMAIIIGRACKSSSDYDYFPRKQTEFLPVARIDKRLKKLEKLYSADKDNLSLLFEISLLKFQKGESFYPESIVAMEKARNGGYMDARIFYYLGYMYQHSGLENYAETEYRRFLYNHPDDYYARMLLGRSLYSQKKYTEAAEIYSSLLKSGKDDIVLLSNLVSSLWKSRQKYDNVLKYLEKKGIKGKYAALYVQGEMLLEDSRYNEAAAYFQEAGKMKPAAGDLNLSILTAKALYKAGDYKSAKMILNEISETSKENTEIKKLSKEIAEKEFSKKITTKRKSNRKK